MNWLTNRHLLLGISGIAILSALTAGLLLLREGRNARRIAELQAAIRRIEAEQVPSLRQDLSDERSSSSSLSRRLLDLESRLAELDRLREGATAQGMILERLVSAAREAEEGAQIRDERIEALHLRNAELSHKDAALASRIEKLQTEALRISQELAALRDELQPPRVTPAGASEKPASAPGQ